MSIVFLVGRAANDIVFSSTLAFATENRPVSWGDFVDPSAQTFEDPHRDLNYDQLENLREIIIQTAKIEDGGLP